MPGGVVKVQDLHRVAEAVAGQIPDPDRAVGDDVDTACLPQAVAQGQGKQPATEFVRIATKGFVEFLHEHPPARLRLAAIAKPKDNAGFHLAPIDAAGGTFGRLQAPLIATLANHPAVKHDRQIGGRRRPERGFQFGQRFLTRRRIENPFGLLLPLALDPGAMLLHIAMDHRIIDRHAPRRNDAGAGGIGERLRGGKAQSLSQQRTERQPTANSQRLFQRTTPLSGFGVLAVQRFDLNLPHARQDRDRAHLPADQTCRVEGEKTRLNDGCAFQPYFFPP